MPAGTLPFEGARPVSALTLPHRDRYLPNTRNQEDAMGLVDYFSKEAKVQRSRQRCLKKLTNMYYQSADRLDAVQAAAGLVRGGDTASIRVLLARFEHIAPNYTTDEQEKRFTFDVLVDLGDGIADEVASYAETTKASPHWALKVLGRFWSIERRRAFVLEQLRGMDNDYWRSPDRKFAMLQEAAELVDDEVAAALLPFVDDHHEDARIHAICALFAHKFAPARDVMIARLQVEESQRISRIMLDGFIAVGWSVAGAEEVIARKFRWEYGVNEAGLLEKRG